MQWSDFVFDRYRNKRARLHTAVRGGAAAWKRALTLTFAAFFAAFAASFLGGCAGGQVVSSGATLPQAATEFSDGPLKVSVSHNCSDGRCNSLTAKFENTSASPLEILAASSRLTRAGQAYPLGRVGDDKGNLVVRAHDSVSAEFQPMGEAANSL